MWEGRVQPGLRHEGREGGSAGSESQPYKRGVAYGPFNALPESNTLSGPWPADRRTLAFFFVMTPFDYYYYFISVFN